MKKRASTMVGLAAAVGLVGATALPASAGKPLAREHIQFEDSGEDLFFAAVCGVEAVLFHESGDIRVTETGERTARIHESIRTVFTNPTTGDRVIRTSSTTHHDELVDQWMDGDVLYQVYETTTTGTPEKWQAPGSGVIVADHGRVTMRTTVGFDVTAPSDAEPFFFDREFLEIAGPHPWAEQGFFFDLEQGEQVCEAMGGSVQFIP